MKKLLMICLMLNSFFGISQGNLEFNQVKLVSTIETVPVGKLWKIESITYALGTPYFGNSTSAIQYYIQINSISQCVFTCTWSYNGPGVVWEQSYPIWLPSGTTLSASTGVNLISVIEFNLVP